MSVTFAFVCLQSVQPLFTAETKPDDASEDQRELHVVSIYEGSTRTGAAIHGERATVSVNRPGRSVVLFLGSAGGDHGVTWTVNAEKGTTIESVILGGRAQQAVEGLPDETPVVEVFGESRDAIYGYYRVESQRTRQLFKQLVKRTKLPISSFYGVYRAESTIRIHQVQDDPQLDVDYPHVDAEGVADVQFLAAYFVQGRRPFDTAASLGVYSLTGGPKLDSLRNTPKNCSWYAFDPQSEQWYGLHENLFALDLTNRTASLLGDQTNVRFSHGRGVTVDTKRNRLLLRAAGELYACSLDNPKLSVVAQVGGIDVSSLCYHEADDSLYGIHLGYDGNSHTIPRLARMNVNGAILSDRRLEGPFFDGMLGDPHHGGRSQLLSVKDHLVLVTSSAGYDSGDGSRYDSETYILLVDPQKSSARLTWKSRNGERPAPRRTSRTKAPPEKEGAGIQAAGNINLDGLPELRFDALFQVKLDHHGQAASWGQFTLGGADTATLYPVPGGLSRVVQDPESKQFYGMDRHRVFRFDLVERDRQELKPGIDVPKPSWPSALAFDAKRHRLLLAARGLLYQCAIGDDGTYKWSVLTEIARGNSVYGMAVEHESDVLYLLTGSPGGRGPVTLQVRDAAGALKDSRALKDGPDASALGRGPLSNAHLLVVNRHLVLLNYPGDRSGTDTLTRMFLIDPADGQTRLTWQQ
jgi:hypothetical protein